jgi:hypothetical protein
LFQEEPVNEPDDLEYVTPEPETEHLPDPLSAHFPGDYEAGTLNLLPPTFSPFSFDPRTNPQDEEDMTTPTREVKIRVPADFIGETTKMKKFIEECELYIRVNPHIYDTDEKKVVFALSFMIGGTATAWKEAFTAKAITDNDFKSWAQFKTDLTTVFSPIDDAGTARTQIKNLK